MSNLSVATGRDEPCPYNLSLSCNLLLRLHEKIDELCER
jgi:hypothetical protein